MSRNLYYTALWPLKTLTDYCYSCTLKLYNQIGEPLTGRSIFLNLFGFSQEELDEDFLDARKALEEKLIYGLYPQVYVEQEIKQKEEILNSIKNGYLLKDILELICKKILYSY